MYLVDKQLKKLTPVPAVSFAKQGLKERQDLQEWLAANPEALGEKLLIIQKEFAGFDGTAERLDLLALDKGFNLVVIENKLDDSGRDVTWQALKYASYCSSLTIPDILKLYQEYLDKHYPGQDAASRLEDFYKGADYQTQINQVTNNIRIILVAASFRKEVTSTVLWLLNYKVRLQCHQVTAYELGDQLLLRVEQLIPLPETQDYTIRMANKAQEEAQIKATQGPRQERLRALWDAVLPLINAKTNLYKNVSATKDAWLSAGSGVRAVPYSFGVNAQSASVLLNISKSNREANKFLFEHLLAQKDEIEQAFGEPLTWDVVDGRLSMQIICRQEKLSYTNDEQWPELKLFLAEKMARLEKALSAPLANANTALGKSGLLNGSGAEIEEDAELEPVENVLVS
jgi:Domain of unknown function (DUF4268)